MVRVEGGSCSAGSIWNIVMI